MTTTIWYQLPTMIQTEIDDNDRDITIWAIYQYIDYNGHYIITGGAGKKGGGASKGLYRI